MKFVSFLLVAMIAMILVVPALSCLAELKNCSRSSDCCTGMICGENGAPGALFCKKTGTVDLGECAKENESCNLNDDCCSPADPMVRGMRCVVSSNGGDPNNFVCEHQKFAVDLGKCAKENESCNLNDDCCSPADPMVRGMRCVVSSNGGDPNNFVCEHQKRASNLSQVRKSLYSALNIIEDN